SVTVHREGMAKNILDKDSSETDTALKRFPMRPKISKALCAKQQCSAVGQFQRDGPSPGKRQFEVEQQLWSQQETQLIQVIQ
ncbi:hypothetical protein WMY93_001561, partial [Mugilogobius chulae]